MGGPPCKTEPTHNPAWKDDTVLWNYLQKGGLTKFIEKIQGFEQDLSIKFAQGWRNRVVKYSYIKVEISEEIISQVTRLSIDGTKFFNKWVDREVEAKKFLDEGENLEFVMAGIKLASVPEPFAEITRIAVRYATLERRFFTIPQKHLIFLNHFHRNITIKFPHYLLNSLGKSVLEVKNHTRAVPLHQRLILLIHCHCSTCPHLDFSHPPPFITPLASIPLLPNRKFDTTSTSKKRKEMKTKVPASQRVLRSHKDLELATNLLPISNLVEEPKDEDLLARFGKMEKEIQELKSAVRDMDKAKGKMKLQNNEEDDITTKIFKNLQSLDGMLGNVKGRNDCILSTLKSIYNFIEQHVRSICSLIGITEDIWGSKEKRDIAIAQ
ncbi:hypothetical protein KI387_036770, partial [Taxus chinensis]